MFEIDASHLSRFVMCNGSRLLPRNLNIPEGVTDNTVRDEGIAAHYLAHVVYTNKFTIEELVDRKAPNGVYIGIEMSEYVNEYLSHLNHAGDIEFDTTRAFDNFRVNGRADHISYNAANRTLRVTDLKYGWSIVDPEMNYTLIWHAYSYMLNLPNDAVQLVEIAIYQPRPNHPDGRLRIWAIDINTFWKHAKTMFDALNNPSDETRTSNYCNKCPSLSLCPTARNSFWNAIEYAEMAYSNELPSNELAFELDQIARIKSMINAREHALHEDAKHRLKSGDIIPNYSLEIGQGNRQWHDGMNCETLKIITGVDLSKSTPVTPAEAERRGVSKELVSSLTERPSTGIRLVRVDANKKAQRIFGNRKG